MTTADLYKIFLKYPNISTDSRKINKGDIFWALSGDNFNGNQFAQNAIDAGAAYAIIDDKKLQGIEKHIFVGNSLQSLQEVATYHRTKLKIPIIAITGTNGKTTSKELIVAVLKKKNKVSYTMGNLNNHIGVPLTILSMNSKTEIGVVEMGANHPGEIKILCNIAQPDFGLITNIGKAHLEGFGSFEALKKTKAELYDWIGEKGILFINKDNEILKSLTDKQKQITYGSSNDAYCNGNLISADPFLSLNVQLENLIEIQTNLIGSYNFENVLAAACIGKYFKIDDIEIKNALENYIPENNRSQIIEKGNSKIILDAYNANPTSLNLAIQNFKNIKADNKIMILGDMFELGEFSEKEHFEICETLIKFIEEEPKTIIYLAGNEFRKTILKNKFQTQLSSFETTEDLIANLRNIEFDKSWILIKGSRGMKLERVLEYLNLS